MSIKDHAVHPHTEKGGPFMFSFLPGTAVTFQFI